MSQSVAPLFFSYMLQACNYCYTAYILQGTEGVYLDVPGTKILAFATAIHSHLHQWIFTSPVVLLDLSILGQQLKVDEGLDLFILSLCRLHTAFLHWPLSSAATKEVQGPDTT